MVLFSFHPLSKWQYFQHTSNDNTLIQNQVCM